MYDSEFGNIARLWSFKHLPELIFSPWFPANVSFRSMHYTQNESQDQAGCTDQLALIKSDLAAVREAFPCGPRV